MKKIIVVSLTFALCLFFSATSYAFEEGTIAIQARSTGFTYTSFDVEGVDASTTDIEIMAGYFFKENLELGLGFSNHSEDDDIFGSFSYTTFFPSIQVYFPTNENYLMLGLAYENTSGDVEGSSINVGAGYIIMIGQRASFDAGFQYTSGDVDVGLGSADFDGFALLTGFSLYF